MEIPDALGKYGCPNCNGDNMKTRKPGRPALGNEARFDVRVPPEVASLLARHAAALGVKPAEWWRRAALVMLATVPK